MTIPALELNDGTSIPQIGLGTYGLRGDEGAGVIASAIELGYRHLDTAARYENEEAVGEGIRRAGVDRDALYVTTKLDGQWQGGERAVAGLAACLDRLGLDYVDLLLIHWPLPARGEFVSTWRTFERLKAEGLTRSIGVSNFTPAHLDVLAAETSTVPAVNQVQLDPEITRAEQRAYHAAHGIITESYSPLGGTGGDLLGSPVIAAIAERHARTPGQIVLRWHVELGLIAIPKSATPSRLEENLAVFNFSLTEGDLLELASLDRGPGAGVDSDHSGH